MDGGNNTYRYALANPIKYIDWNGKITIEEGCCNGDAEDLEGQIQESCKQVANNISDPKLRKCMLDRCKSGHVSCNGKFCLVVQPLGWQSPIFSGNNEITLCLSSHKEIDSINQWGCVAMHEWAHSCGWEHGDGAGVPGDTGELEPSECIRKKWSTF